MSESIVKVEHLSHRYSVQWAVRDINLEISQTGIVGLLGSNGAGKSTIMNIICGVLSQTEGTVLINGIDLRKDPVAAKRYAEIARRTGLSYICRSAQTDGSKGYSCSS